MENWKAVSLEMKCFVIIMANTMDGNTMVSCSRATDGQPGAHEESQPTWHVIFPALQKSLEVLCKFEALLFMKDMEDLLSGRQRSLTHGMEHFWSMKGCWREEMSELFSPSELEKTLITMNFRLGLAKKKFPKILPS